MIIYKHKTLDIPTSIALEIIENALRHDKRYPGIAIDITEDHIAVSPEDVFTFDPSEDPDYEVIVYDES